MKKIHISTDNWPWSLFYGKKNETLPGYSRTRALKWFEDFFKGENKDFSKELSQLRLPDGITNGLIELLKWGDEYNDEIRRDPKFFGYYYLIREFTNESLAKDSFLEKKWLLMHAIDSQHISHQIYTSYDTFKTAVESEMHNVEKKLETKKLRRYSIFGGGITLEKIDNDKKK